MNGAVRDRILVANDGSEHSLHRSATSLPSWIGIGSRWSCFMLSPRSPNHSWTSKKKFPRTSTGLVSIEPWEKQQQKAICGFMEKARAILLDAGFPNEAITLRMEDRNIGISQDITAESRNGYKALVLGRRGHSDFKDFMLGSVAEHILGLVPIPVWIVGGGSQPIKVLACLDGSEESMFALTHFADVLDTSKDFEITLFHAVPGFHSFRNFVREVFSSEGDKTAVEQIVRELDKAAAALEPSFDNARAALISRGVDPARIHQKIARGSGGAGARHCGRSRKR